MKKRFTQTQIAFALRQAESGTPRKGNEGLCRYLKMI